MEWKPIETAPDTDCFNEVLVSDGKFVTLGYVDERDGKWRDATNCDDMDCAIIEPTKWMPKPPA